VLSLEMGEGGVGVVRELRVTEGTVPLGSTSTRGCA